MRIVHHGIVPGSALRRAHCPKCKSLVEFEEREATFMPDQRMGDYFALKCVACNADITQSKAVPVYDPEKAAQMRPPSAIELQTEAARAQLHAALEKTGSVHSPTVPHLMQMAAVQLNTLMERLG